MHNCSKLFSVKSSKPNKSRIPMMFLAALPVAKKKIAKFYYLNCLMNTLCESPEI